MEHNSSTMKRLSSLIFSSILDLSSFVTIEGRPERTSSCTFVYPPLIIMHHFLTEASSSSFICLKTSTGGTFAFKKYTPQLTLAMIVIFSHILQSYKIIKT